MVQKSNQGLPAKDAVAVSTKEGSARLEVTFEPGPKGAGTIRLRYRGALTNQPKAWVRIGERREGKDWIDPRDIPMNVSNGVATVTIDCAPGAPIEGACLAFFTAKDSAPHEQLWDNAGRSFGYYLYDVATGRIEAR